MLITENKTIGEIKKEFNEKFPALKLEFYSKPHKAGEGSLSKDTLDENATISQVRTQHIEGDISIHSNQKVSTLEQNFLKNYGLNAQVFYQSGDTWFQTTATDHWTLAKQVERATETADFSDISFE